jgi:FkbM family methyltransferase
MLENADVIVDVDANSGIFSCLAVELGKQAIAFEPMPSTLAVLLAVVERNGFADRIEVMPVAASDRVGVVPFYGRGQGASMIQGWGNIADFDRILVPTNTLDNLLVARITGEKVVLKIDVEGAAQSAQSSKKKMPPFIRMGRMCPPGRRRDTASHRNPPFHRLH